MKNIKYALFALALVFVAQVAYAQGTIYFSVENQKSSYKPGDTISMYWSSDDIPLSKTVSIYIQSIEKGFLYPIKGSLALSGSYKWTIPNTTAAASDYRLSMSTNDVGPSAWSNDSKSFAIASDKKTSSSIKTFTTKVSPKKKGEGKINIKIERNNGARMALNIGCPESKIELSGKSGVISCNTWTYFGNKKENIQIDYKNFSNTEETVSFTLDLYADDGALVQRQFKHISIKGSPDSKMSSAYSILRTDHVLGNKNAQVTLFTYMDLECPYCKVFHKTLKQLQKEYGTKLAIVYRHYPLHQLHKKALDAAHGAECSADQKGDKGFYTFIDGVYAESWNLTDTVLAEIAEDMGLNETKFQQCMDSDKHMTKILEQLNTGTVLGVQGTPTSYAINKEGEKVTIDGAQPYSVVKDIIDSLLE